MKLKLYRLEIILNLNTLKEVKNNLMKDLMNPMLKWTERIELYQSVQWINIRMMILYEELEKRESA